MVPCFGHKSLLANTHTFSHFMMLYVYLIAIILLCCVLTYLCSLVCFISAQLFFSRRFGDTNLECWVPSGPLKRMTKES